MKKTLTLFAFIIPALIARGQVTNIEADGNLKATASIESLELLGITNENTPADIFQLIHKSINQGKYKKATMEYIAAMAYGMYDRSRVSDETAHQAISVLSMNMFGSLKEEQIEEFQAVIDTVITNKVEIFNTLSKLGKPSYHPKYMIQHGMGAFTGNKTKNGLVPNFDADASWNEILSQFKD